MKKKFSKILAFSFALIIPLTAFLITTNQKKVSASESFDRYDFYEFFDDTYFDILDTDSILRGTGTNIQYNFNNYQYTPKLNIPYLSNNFVLSGNSFIYDYTLDSTTYYTLTRSKFLDYLVMYSPTLTKYISFDFNNLVLFFYNDDNNLDKSEFVGALSYYFSFIEFALNMSNASCDINISGTVADLSGGRNVSFDTYLYSNINNDVLFTDRHSILDNFFNGLYDYYGEINSDFSTSRLNGNLVDFTHSKVLNYYNSYFIVPNINISFTFNTEVVFYLRSKLYDYTLDNLYSQGNYTNLYAYNLYRPDFINTILGYYGYDSYFKGFHSGYTSGYVLGYRDGENSLQPFDAVISIVENFLNFEIFPGFHVYYFFLIAFGFALFGLLVKYALGG